MTDGPNEDELGEPLSEEAAEGEIQGEAWQDDLPPEDDFQDVEEPAEEIVEEEGVVSEAEEATSVDKKRGKKVLFGVLAVAVALVGGMAYLQLGSNGPVSAPSPMTAALDVKAMKETKPETSPVGQDIAPVTPKTGEADLSALYKAAQPQDQRNIAAVLPNAKTGGSDSDKPSLGTSTEIMGLSDSLPPPAVAPAPVMAPPPAPAPEVAKIENVPMPELQPAPEEKTKPVAALAVAAAPSVEEDARLKDMKAQIEELKAALDRAVQKIDALQKNEVPASLEERLTSLEKKIEGQKAETTSSIAIQEPASPKDEFANEPVKQVQTAKAAKPAKAKSPAKKAAVKKEPKAAKKTGGWVLRAATPDAAWVSQGDYEAELRRVAVGDSLPGVGKIKEIRQKGDIWEVVGTKGVLK